MKKRRTTYRTQYTSRHRAHGTGGGATRWMAVALVAGLAVYIALAMGVGNGLHDLLAGRQAPVENELEDSEAPAPTDDGEITETVAFPAMESYVLAVEGFTDEEEARYNAALYAARGGAGYVTDSGEEICVFLAAYDSQADCENVAQTLRQEENITASVQPLTIDAVELKLTALPRRVDGIRDAFSIWQQTVQMLSDLWQDIDGGLCSQGQAIQRLENQRDKLDGICQEAFSDALIEGQATALDGLYAVISGTVEQLDAILADPPQNVLEVSSKIKYTGIENLTQYQSYVESLKAQDA